jgi:methyl-accepting chemotaxis protein
MGRTSIKNKIILSFLALLLIVMAVVGIVNRISDDFYLALAISTAFALTAGIIFGSIFSRSLVNRLTRLGNITREVSQGDLSKDIPLLSMDEIRDLEEAFSKMLNDLRSILLETRSVSVQIQKTNAHLNGLADKVKENSHEIDQTAESIAKSSEEQTLIVQKTALRVEDALNEMDDMVKQSAATVSKVKEARFKTETVEANARQSTSHLENVLKQMIEYTQPMYRLANKVEKINLVINIMDDIAQKTDLLSLNASIEAVRAGESGKGFALVADEIRSMAENSKRSSKEIRQMIEDILEDNRAVTNALQQTQGGIAKGREFISGTLGMFGEMLNGVKEISDAVKVIEGVGARQVKQLSGLTDHFQELSRLADKNFVSTQKTTMATKKQKQDTMEIVNAVKSLSDLSEKMAATQQRFRLGDGHAVMHTDSV